ncbi:MAG: hypothetical protein ACI3XA_10315 [Clostridia bacterium]
MQKHISYILVIFTMICVTACTPQGDSTYQNTDDSNQQYSESVDNYVETPNESTDKKSTNSTSTNNYYGNYNQVQENKQSSTTVAISNAIIIEDNHENKVVYKKKCDSCGYTEPSTTVTTPGSFTGGFYCPNCEETKKVELKTTYSN